ncbi:MAG: hypothetical protein U0787_23400 [Polyangia bacterium]
MTIAKECRSAMGGAQGVVGMRNGLVARTGELAAFTLLRISSAKPYSIDDKALLATNHLRQVEREAVGVVQLERDLARQGFLAGSVGGKLGLADQAQAAVDGAAEAFTVFGVDGFFDQAFGFAQLWVDVPEQLGDFQAQAAKN